MQSKDYLSKSAILNKGFDTIYDDFEKTAADNVLIELVRILFDRKTIGEQERLNIEQSLESSGITLQNILEHVGQTEAHDKRNEEHLLTTDELREHLQKIAERPIDIEMIKQFHNIIEKKINLCSRLLQTVVLIATDQRGEIDIIELEREADIVAQELEAKYPLLKENMVTVLEYFEEYRILDGLGVLTLKEFTGTSAHRVAMQYIEYISKGWRECRGTAYRSQTDLRYAYATTASHLFFQSFYINLPKPQTVYELAREEVVKARCKLREVQKNTALVTTSPTLSPSSKRFKIALSFPGEHREFIRQVADSLAIKLGKWCILYDSWYEAEFARPDLDTYLQRLYHNESELIAVFLCADYERKEWCGLEWRAIRDLIKRRQTSSIMPLRFDNTEIPGLFSTDGYVWIGERPASEIADLIFQRLQNNTVANEIAV